MANLLQGVVDEGTGCRLRFRYGLRTRSGKDWNDAESTLMVGLSELHLILPEGLGRCGRSFYPFPEFGEWTGSQYGTSDLGFVYAESICG